MVIAMLTVLLLFAVTFTRSAKLEEVASANFALGTQSRIAAATGLPGSTPLIQRATNLTWLGQSWKQVSWALNEAAQEKSSSQQTDTASQLYRAGYSDARATTEGKGLTGLPSATFDINDLSGRVNVNFVRSDAAWQRFLAEALGPDATADPVAAAAGLRPAASLRGLGLVSTRKRLARAALESTAPIETLSQLLPKERKTPGVLRADEVRALSSYITTFSAAPEVFNRADGTSVPKVALSSTSLEDLIAALTAAYPDKDPRLILQFAANIVDARDPDAEPTTVEDPATPGPWDAIFGEENTPLITEVFPNSKVGLSTADAGQFIEIWNPTTGTLSLDGWRLGLAESQDRSAQVTWLNLMGSVPSGGYMIVTDNYDHPAAGESSGAGSFLAIFGAAADQQSRQVQEVPTMKLAPRSAGVLLLSPNGKLADAFSYGADIAGGQVSYQRAYPRLRVSTIGAGSPFQPAPGATATAYLASGVGNGPVAGPFDLLRISTAFVSGVGAGRQAHSDQRPLMLVSRNSKASGISNLDCGVADLFTEQTSATASCYVDGSTTQPHLFSSGKLNLNTCSKAALHSIESTVDGWTWLTDSVLEKVEAYRLSQMNAGQPPFLNPSELAQFLPDDSDRSIRALALVGEQITCGSAAFEVTAENRPGNAGPGRRPSVVRQRWVLALDRPGGRLVDYSSQE